MYVRNHSPTKMAYLNKILMKAKHFEIFNFMNDVVLSQIEK